MSKDITLVIPTMNEEEGIKECIERAWNAFDELGMDGEIIVSDSSTDRTPEIAEENGARVVTPDKPGYGYAYRYAFERAEGDLIAMGDGDTTYDFEELPKLVRLVQDGADMAMGSRLDGEIRSGSMPKLHQYIGNPLLTRFLNLFYDAGVSDSHSGMRVFTREAYEKMELETDGMEFASEMIMEAGAKDLKIEEAPIVYHERKGDATLHSFRDGWRHVKFMLVNSPDYLFFWPGILSLILGLGVLGFSMAEANFRGTTLGSNSAVAGSLLIIIGFQVVSFSALTYYGSDPVKKSGRLRSLLDRHFSLEKGLAGGALVFLLGALYSGLLVGRWYTSGYSDVPELVESITGFTAILLGIQTIYQSFMINILSDEV
jgi:glycosyltransferase involved in cell wall biosynthesis